MHIYIIDIYMHLYSCRMPIVYIHLYIIIGIEHHMNAARQKGMYEQERMARPGISSYV